MASAGGTPEAEALARREPADFDAFWARTLDEARAAARRAPASRPVETPLRTIQVETMAFDGFGGHRVQAWLLTPAGAGPFPAIVEYLGYGGGRSLPTARLFWASVGYAHLVMDSRGQDGDTPDPAALDTSGHQPGFVTQGLESPETYYYRRLYVDAVHAVEALILHPAIDAGGVVVSGHSQGGGVALAVAGLSSIPRAALIDAPFLCAIRRGLDLVGDDVAVGYGELRAHLAWRRDREATALRTLDYFDGCSFARRAAARARFSVGQRDRLCPAETGLVAFESYAGPKELRVWPHNGHELGMEYDDVEKLDFLRTAEAS